MFNGVDVFNQNIGLWDTSSVTDMSYLFHMASAFDQYISGWDTSSVTDMRYMFYSTSAFDQNLGGWDVSALTNATSMFANKALATVNYDALLIGWNSQVLNSGVTFSGGNSTFCLGESARQNMIDTDNWIITDGGKYCEFIPVYLPLVMK